MSPETDVPKPKRRRKNKITQGVRMRCLECGANCRTLSGLCWKCRHIDNSPVGLKAGYWAKRKHGIWVWVDTEPCGEGAETSAPQGMVALKEHDTSRPRPERQLQMTGASPTERNTTDS